MFQVFKTSQEIMNANRLFLNLVSPKEKIQKGALSIKLYLDFFVGIDCVHLWLCASTVAIDIVCVVW